MAETTICDGLAWGEALPNPATNAWQTKSLHYTGVVSFETDEALTLNVERAVFMYAFLGQWHKAFGVPGDSLPDLLSSLFGRMSKGLMLIEDSRGHKVSINEYVLLHVVAGMTQGRALLM